MKMKPGTRVIFTIYILIMAAVCIFIIASILSPQMGQAFVSLIQNGMFAGGIFSIIWAVIAGILAIVGICLLFFGIRKPEPAAAMVSASPDGVVMMTLGALEELARRFLTEISEVTPLRVGIRAAEHGIRISLHLTAKSEVIIPEVTQKIQEGLKYYIEKFSGISVTDVKITIEPLKQPTSTLPR